MHVVQVTKPSTVETRERQAEYITGLAKLQITKAIKKNISDL